MFTYICIHMYEVCVYVKSEELLEQCKYYIYVWSYLRSSKVFWYGA